MGRLIRIAVLVAVLAVAASFYCCRKPHQEPVRYPDSTTWGDFPESTHINPYTVKISKDTISEIRRRVLAYKHVTPLKDVGYTYGLPKDALETVLKLWREKYDWEKAEARINSFPQFVTAIHGLQVHFIHAKANVKDENVKRIPLLLVHGWPGSIYEFHNVIPMLTQPKDGVVFDVVAPSIPGYGFSSSPTKAGFNPIAAAQVFGVLMKRLGYEKYIYQGGDWGSVIGNVHTRMFPDNVLGFHSNMATPPATTTCDLLHFIAAVIAPEWVVGENDAKKINKDKLNWMLDEFGYAIEQGTKPDTLGVALSDSPVGIAAYILEKFATWSENVEFKTGKGISNEDILTNIMIYIVSEHATSAIRFYRETFKIKSELDSWMRLPFAVPTAVACYPSEILCSPKSLLSRQMPHLVHYADLPTGGHFAAFEVPQIFADDLRVAAKAILEARAKGTSQ